MLRVPHRRRTHARAVLARVASACLALVILAACSPSGGAPTVDAGSVDLTVQGLPAGVDAEVVFSGPATVETRYASGRFELAAGSYDVRAESAHDADPIAAAAYDGEAVPRQVEVVDGSYDEITASYVRRTGTGRVLLAAGPTLDLFLPEAWAAGGTVAPAASLTLSTAADQLSDLLLPRDGDLLALVWRPGEEDDEGNPSTPDGHLLRYARASLDQDGAAPAGEVAVGATPYAMAWYEGSVFVYDAGFGVIFRFDDPGAIVGVDAVAASATLTIDGFANGGGGVAFDADGRLWVSTATALVRIDAPSEGEGAVTVTPSLVLEHTQSVPRHLLVYDRGHLLVGIDGPGEVHRYDGVDSAVTSGLRGPDAVLHVGVDGVLAMAHDASGRSWIVGRDGFSVLRIGRYPDLIDLADGTIVPPMDAIVLDGASVKAGVVFAVAP